MRTSQRRLLRSAVVLMLPALFLTSALEAACMNKFVFRADGPRMVITLLTGKMTFQEAQDLAGSIAAKKTPPLEWVDAAGKSVAKQTGELKVVRPMPVGCDDKASGVVLNVSFLRLIPPSGAIDVKLGSQTVHFEEQKQ